MKLRRDTLTILRRFNSYYRLKGESRVNLDTLDGFFTFISKTHKHPSKAIEQHYSEELFLINLLLVSFGSLTLSSGVNSPKNKNVILRKDFSGRDVHLCGFLNNICNTTSAAV